MRAYEYMHDLTDIFDGDEYIFIDNAHVSRRGNEIVASRISELVDAQTAATPRADTIRFVKE